MTILDTDGQCKYTEHCIVLLSVRNELGSSSADRESGMAPPSPGSGAFGDIDSSNLTKKVTLCYILLYEAVHAWKCNMCLE